jgi:CMP-N,N'-diacetyllegionaminic acid synthase
MSVVAVVPARSGSKGFSHKNVARLGGKTLLELAVKVGIDSRCIDKVYVSTDSQDYADIAISAGATFEGLRPDWLASDNAKTIDVVIDLLTRIGESYDHLILLQPTSPIRSPKDVDAAFATFSKYQADSVVSVELLDEPHPEKVKCIGDDGFLKSYIVGASSEIPRQSLPKAYRLNGAIYIVNISVLLTQLSFLPEKTIPYQMSRGVNIDSEEDFILLRTLFEMGRVNIYGASRS